jgi:hypothetical protein
MTSLPETAELMARVGALHFNYATDMLYIDIPHPSDSTRRRLFLNFSDMLKAFFKE